VSSDTPIPLHEILSHAAWLRRLVHDLVRDPGRADDVLQETWLRAVERPPARGGSLRGWLARVARNASIDAFRQDRQRTARERRRNRPGPARPTVDSVANAELHRRVVDAVLALPEPYRRTLLDHYFEGKRPHEIAREAGEPAATARSRLKRGLDRLRTRFEREGGADWQVALLPLALLPKGAAGGGAATLGTGGAVMAVKTKVVAGTLLALGAVTAATGIYLGVDRLNEKPELPPVRVELAAEDPGKGGPTQAPETVPGSPEVARAAPPEPAGARSVSLVAGTRRLLELGRLLETGGKFENAVGVLEGDSSPITLAYSGPIHEALRLISEQAKVPIRVAGPLKESFRRTIHLNFDQATLRDALTFISSFTGTHLHPVEGGGLEFRLREPQAAVKDRLSGPDLMKEVGRELWEEMQVRESFRSAEDLMARRFTLSPTTRIEDLDGLYWAMQREVRHPLSILVSDSVRKLECVTVLREGTAGDILRAALGPIRGGRLAATRRGLELLPRALATAAEEDSRSTRDAIERLGKLTIEEASGTVYLSDLGGLVAKTSGLPVHIDSKVRGREVEIPKGTTCREALDAVIEAFPRLGWTVVSGVVVVLPLNPPPH